MRTPNEFRVRTGPFGSNDSRGCNGAFFIPNRAKDSNAPLKVICSDGEGWEHVSISLPHRCPTWDEMCKVKALFWDDEDTVMQLHPPRSQWISNHPYCLHLWRPRAAAIPLPPSIMVGYADLGDVVNGSKAVQTEAVRRYVALSRSDS